MTKALPRGVWAALALALAGCASAPAPAPDVQQGVAEGGARTVTVAPASAVCAQPRCPAFAAQWSSARAGLAVLTVGLPYQKAEVTGADFHFGNTQVVRLRLRSDAPAQPMGYPASAFDAPLSLIAAMAYKPNGWVRVYTADGLTVDEVLQNGEERSAAMAAMGRFLTAVETASGQPVRGGIVSGGAFER